MPIDPSSIPPFKHLKMSQIEAAEKLSISRRTLSWDSDFNLISVPKRWHTKDAVPLYDVIRFENGCWIWTASKRDDGYGQLTVAKVNVKAHHFMYLLFVGPIPKGLCCLHRCDVPACVNPDHLFLGTQIANIDDMLSKGRHWKIFPKRLTKEQVFEIRKSTETLTWLASKYGCSRGTIYRARCGRTFKDLT